MSLRANFNEIGKCATIADTDNAVIAICCNTPEEAFLECSFSDGLNFDFKDQTVGCFLPSSRDTSENATIRRLSHLRELNFSELEKT